ncbi:MAG: pcaC [Acidimicrobiales bacterium]|nr:pcaC [Acidimicrobiales bacterium]
MDEQQQRFERALEVSERIYGGTGMRDIAARGYRTQGLRDFSELTFSHCMLDLWDRPQLDLRARSIAQIAGLMAMRQWEELEIHMKLGLKNGITPDELMEVILQTTVYGGQAMGHTAVNIAGRVFKESGIDERKRDG